MCTVKLQIFREIYLSVIELKKYLLQLQHWLNSCMNKLKVFDIGVDISNAKGIEIPSTLVIENYKIFAGEGQNLEVGM